MPCGEMPPQHQRLRVLGIGLVAAISSNLLKIMCLFIGMVAASWITAYEYVFSIISLGDCQSHLVNSVTGGSLDS